MKLKIDSCVDTDIVALSHHNFCPKVKTNGKNVFNQVI